ncbi:MAG: mannose-6-phosphate isomerase, class I, partial [Myxococcota bacterium]
MLSARSRAGSALGVGACKPQPTEYPPALMTVPAKPPAPMLLAPSLQRYAWGDPRFIPTLLGLEPNAKPCAEAWFGAHPHAPATVCAGGTVLPLDRLLADKSREILGKRTEERFGSLPYLLKILAAAIPLSIQVHPNRDQAEAGYAREHAAGVPENAPHRSYRDRNHKPELLVAVTPFHALCGFRPPDEIARALDTLPEIKPLLPPWQPGPEGLKALLEAYFALPDDRLLPALDRLVRRLEAQNETAAFPSTEPAHWALQAHRTLSPDGTPDRGLLFVFLLALLHLEPGQGIFLPPGFPHAYLEGAAVEIMASSDNVLRAGLTPKPIDPAELLRIVSFNAGAPPIVEPYFDDGGLEGCYPAAAAEYDLHCLRLGLGDELVRTTLGPEILLAMPEAADDTVTLTTEYGPTVLERGQACLVPHDTHYTLTANGRANVYRAAEPTE